MKESARAAWSYARSNAEALSIEPEGFERDVHIHVPAGAIPKDGPSARRHHGHRPGFQPLRAPGPP